MDEERPGFRLQRDPESNFFVLEVSNRHSSWKIFIKELPTDWFHFSFTWRQSGLDNTLPNFLSGSDGLRVYINGELKLSKVHPDSMTIGGYKSDKDSTVNEFDVHKLLFGRVGPLRTMKHAGKFQFGHLAIWRKALTDEEVKKTYRVNINSKLLNYQFCCVKKEQKGINCIRIILDSKNTLVPSLQRDSFIMIK